MFTAGGETAKTVGESPKWSGEQTFFAVEGFATSPMHPRSSANV